jgi:MFS family permease
MRVKPKGTATEPRIPAPKHNFLGVFRYRDFSLLWSGLLIGNIGTWMQFTALGYYLAKMAPNAAIGSFYIGLLGASRMIPVFLTSPFAGVVADRYPRRPILLSTNVLTAVLAILLSVALQTNTASLWVVLIISGLQAATQAFDAPARQSWVGLLVPRENVANAIGLNSVAFNLPSVIGPPLAGLTIAAVGIAPCMTVNSVLKLVVVLAVALMRPSPGSSPERASFRAAIVEGVTFLYSHPVLRWIFVMLISTSLTARSYSILLPAYAVHVIHTDARGLGWLMASTGIGAMLGAFAVAGSPFRRRSLMWFFSAVLASGGVAVLGLTHSLVVAAVTLAFVGLGSQGFVGSSNVLIQMLAPVEMRGRAVSIYSMIMLGFVPGGALLMGTIATLIDLRMVFFGAGLFATLMAVWTYAAHPRLRAS